LASEQGKLFLDASNELTMVKLQMLAEELLNLGYDRLLFRAEGVLKPLAKTPECRDWRSISAWLSSHCDRRWHGRL